MIIKQFETDTDGTRLLIQQSGNSIAYAAPRKFKTMTALLSEVSGGVATVEYSLSDSASVVADTAIWHTWSVGEVDAEGGTAFDAPIAYLRIIAAEGVSYTFEALV